MKNKTRFLVLTALLSAIALTWTAAAFGQSKGLELYNKLADRNLVRIEGLRAVRWTPEGGAYIIEEGGSFKKVDPRTGDKSPLFDDGRIAAAYAKVTGKPPAGLPFKEFAYTSAGTKIQFTEDNGMTVYIYDLAAGDLKRHRLRYSTSGVRGRRYSEVFSPDLRYTAYSKNWNLCVHDLEKDQEIALTTDGTEDLRNAFPDWVYPEELSQYEVFWWSPDSKMIGFMQFDESPVRKYPLVHDAFIPTSLELESYPKAGANNPIVRLFVADVETKKIVKIDTGVETNVYLYGCRWTNDGKEFVYRRMNRLQNRVEVLAADPKTGKSRILLVNEEPCYINEGLELIFLKDNKRFLWTSEISGWKEVYLYDLTGKLVKQLTNQKLPVGAVLEVDEASGWIYFSGFENRGCDSHLYRVKLDGTGFAKLTAKPGSHSVSVAPGGKYFVDNFSSWDDPSQADLYDGDGKLIRQLGKTLVTEEFKKLSLINSEHFVFKSADGKDDIDGMLFKPADFDPNKKYPVYYSVYGGPGARQVSNSWAMASGNQRLAQLGFIVIQTDHSGSSNRGKAFQTKSYLRLGEVELADHVAAVKHLAAKYPWFDAARVGITGHSYGGYLTCIALLKAPDVFHVGVAGAPVTDWQNYDSIYTERYMRWPEINPAGYENGSCMKYAKNLKGKLQIHHGAVDDNVHPGNTIQLVQALLKEGKRFDWKIYPEQQHGIRFNQYGQDRLDFMIRNLKPETWKEWFKEN